MDETAVGSELQEAVGAWRPISGSVELGAEDSGSGAGFDQGGEFVVRLGTVAEQLDPQGPGQAVDRLRVAAGQLGQLDAENLADPEAG